MNKSLALLLVPFAALACNASSAGEDGSLRAVATTSLVADLVREVGGDRVTVVSLMGAGVDPHLYRASEGDVRTLSEAEVIFYSGLHLEAKMAEVLERMDGATRTFAVTDGIPREALLAPPEFAGNYDPHVWFDVALWKGALQMVVRSLSEMRPADSSYFRANAERYTVQLDSLELFIRARAAEVAEQQRVIVTAHDAFNYFGRAYGFEVRGLQGISTASEAGAADVRNLADFIVARRVPSMFVESSVPRRSIEAVQAAVVSRGFNVTIGGQLYSDALGNPGTPAGRYIGMLRANVNTIVDGLLGVGGGAEQK